MNICDRSQMQSLAGRLAQNLIACEKAFDLADLSSVDQPAQ
jgi:hypothetical protein